MINWLQFFTILLWLSVLFFISNFNNFIKLLFFSELIWVVLYCYTLYSSIVNDDIVLLSTGVFVLGFAGLEYSIGIVLILAFKGVNKTIELCDTFKEGCDSSIYTDKKLYINRYIYK